MPIDDGLILPADFRVVLEMLSRPGRRKRSVSARGHRSYFRARRVLWEACMLFVVG